MVQQSHTENITVEGHTFRISVTLTESSGSYFVSAITINRAGQTLPTSNSFVSALDANIAAMRSVRTGLVRLAVASDFAPTISSNAANQCTSRFQTWAGSLRAAAPVAVVPTQTTAAQPVVVPRVAPITPSPVPQPRVTPTPTAAVHPRVVIPMRTPPAASAPESISRSPSVGGINAADVITHLSDPNYLYTNRARITQLLTNPASRRQIIGTSTSHGLFQQFSEHLVSDRPAQNTPIAAFSMFMHTQAIPASRGLNISDPSFMALNRNWALTETSSDSIREYAFNLMYSFSRMQPSSGPNANFVPQITRLGNDLPHNLNNAHSEAFFNALLLVSCMIRYAQDPNSFLFDPNAAPIQPAQANPQTTPQTTPMGIRYVDVPTVGTIRSGDAGTPADAGPPSGLVGNVGTLYEALLSGNGDRMNANMSRWIGIGTGLSQSGFIQSHENLLLHFYDLLTSQNPPAGLRDMAASFNDYRRTESPTSTEGKIALFDRYVNSCIANSGGYRRDLFSLSGALGRTVSLNPYERSAFQRDSYHLMLTYFAVLILTYRFREPALANHPEQNLYIQGTGRVLNYNH